MKRKLTHNLGLKIISILFAIVLWLVVINIVDPVESKQFNNIQVTVQNDSVIKNQGKVYDIIDNSDVISITVKGRRSALDKMKSADFVAVADMNEMIVIDTVPIAVTATRNTSKIQEIEPKTRTLKISVEDSASKQFAITASISGTPVEGYAVGDITLNPSVLKVTGAASVVNKISKVEVSVDVRDVTTPVINITATPKFYDSDGDLIESTSLEYKNDEIEVSADLLETKEVALNFKVKGTPADDYQYVETVYSPDKITIAGDDDALAKINSLDIVNNTIDISNATGNVQKVIDITSYLPSDVRLVDSSEASILVTAVLEKLETKIIEVPKSSVQILNPSSKFTFSYTNNDNIMVTVKGLAENLSGITGSNIAASIDLSNVDEAGTKTLPVKITLSEGIDATISGEVTVNGVMTKNNTNKGSKKS